jgi:NodT family efflux transporter outer membrane factor (OMF) lipoprotein
MAETSNLMAGGARARLRRSLLALPLLLLSGCIVLGPDFKQPQTAWIDDWSSAALEGVTRNHGPRAPLQQWWSVFQDPALTALIELALQENPGLQIAGLRVLESRAQLGIADSLRYPQLQQLSGNSTYSGRSVSDGGEDQQLWQYRGAFGLGWELDFWGRFQRSIEAADASYFASIANYQDFRVLLTAQVAELYFGIRTTEARLRIAHENAALQRRSYEITERLFLSGNHAELDLQQARTQYLATMATIPQLEAGLLQTRNALNTLLARPPGPVPELARSAGELPQPGAALLDDVPAALLQRRPDVRAAASQLAAQTALLGVAEADLYPTLNLGGSLAWSTTSQSGAPSVLEAAAGPGLVWNVFDHGRIRNNILVQDARLQQLVENYRNTVLQAAREADDAAIGFSKALEQEQLLSDSKDSAARAHEISTRQYQEGYSDFQRVLDAQRALFNQQERHVNNRGAAVASLVNLYKALGGGWSVAAVEPLVSERNRAQMRERSDWGVILESAPATGPSRTP